MSYIKTGHKLDYLFVGQDKKVGKLSCSWYHCANLTNVDILNFHHFQNHYFLPFGGDTDPVDAVELVEGAIPSDAGAPPCPSVALIWRESTVLVPSTFITLPVAGVN